MVNYQNGKLYKIVNGVNDEIYVGSTCRSLSMRMANHRASAKIHTSKLYQSMTVIGVKHFKIVLLCEFPCDNNDQLRAKEHEYIQLLKPVLNQLGAYQTAEEKKKYLAKYQKNNPDVHLKSHAKYRLKMTHCDTCDVDFSLNNLYQHQRSKKHQALLQ